MLWPSWLWIGTPTKVTIWLTNRLATWTGVYYFWRRFRTHRYFWPLLITINLASVSALGLIFYWLHTQAHH